jgi:MFS family permease
VRYARHSRALRTVLIRVGVFILAASALWALLPIVANRELGLDAGGYGLLLGSLGLGAVAGALLLPRLRESLEIDRMTAAASIAFALATLALGYLQLVILLIPLLVLGGFAWMAMMSSLNVAAQGSAPAWVRARALAVYLLVFQGGTAIGSFGWGILADVVGNRVALAVASVALVLSMAAAWRWRLSSIQGLDLTPVQSGYEPELVAAPRLEDGPVMMSVEYRVEPDRAPDFVAAMQRVGRMRRRTGAYEWELYRDPTQPDRFVETYLTRTWAEHLRQHTRPTVTDQKIQDDALALIIPGTIPVVSHLVATDARQGRKPGQ